jgi:signal transduction histidine kinase
MEVGRGLLSELDPDVVFEQVLAEARSVTGARYGAIGVLSENRRELSRFLTSGIDADGRRAIGDLPRGRGVLGVLIDEPAPLRLADVGAHSESFGFPSGHPEMGSFLGVPILIRDRAWGNLYLTEKTDGSAFTQVDEDAAVILAQFAATAIENARLYQRAETGRQEFARAIRGLEAARTISDAIGAEANLETILELIVKRGRALVGARSVLIFLTSTDGEAVTLVAGTGTTGDRRGAVLPLAGTSAGRVLREGVPLRIDTFPEGEMGRRDAFGVADVRTALLMPMIHRGQGIGVLIALDRGAEQLPFTDADEELMQTFASSAANAVAISRSVEIDRLAATIDAAESERRRWARELHDQTLQSLGGLRIMLAGAARKDTLETFRTAVAQAVGDLEREIASLRGIISDLRPQLLDDLGLADALGALVDRHREGGLSLTLIFSLEDPDSGAAVTLSAELETTVYRLIQEALTNVAKHAQADIVEVRVGLPESGRLRLEVIDDGVGFDADAPNPGFGLAGIRERVYLSGGTISFTPGSGGGTTLRVEMPATAEDGPLERRAVDRRQADRRAAARADRLG